MMGQTGVHGSQQRPNDLYGIWGIAGTGVFAVGDGGKIFSYTGDVDGDGVLDVTDNCTEIENPSTDRH